MRQKNGVFNRRTSWGGSQEALDQAMHEYGNTAFTRRPQRAAQPARPKRRNWGSVSQRMMAALDSRLSEES